jgi:hypothetical protein
MVSPGECQRKAQECARLERYVETPQMKVALSNVERTWLRLADQCQRLEDLMEVIAESHPIFEIATEPPMDNADCLGLARMLD